MVTALTSLTLLVLGSCTGDAVGPPASQRNLSLQLTASTPVPSARIDANGAYMTCDLEVFASATGEQGAIAPWSGATFRFAFGADRSTFTDSVRVGAEQVRAAWGTDGPAAGQAATSRWTAVGGLPFTIQLEFRYLTSITANPTPTIVEVDCGPRGPAEPTSGPGVSEIQLSPAVLEIGDPVEVTYSATAEAGLWVTGVEYSGAMQRVEHRLGSFATSTSQSVEMTTGFGMSLDTLVVRVFAVDVLGRVYRSAPGRVPVTDTRPPSIASVHFQGDMSGIGAGALASADTLRLTVNAGDNHRLDRLVYRFEGAVTFQDSVPFQPQIGQSYSIPMRDEWIGGSTLTVTAVDAAGNRTVWRSEPGALQVYPQVQRPIRTAELSARHTDVVFDRGGDRLLLALPAAGRIEQVAVSGLEAVTAIAFPGGQPSSMDMTPEGDRMVVALHGDTAVAIVDAATHAVLRTVAFQPGESFAPWLVRATTAGRAIVLGRRAHTVRLVELDLVSGAQRVILDSQHVIGDEGSAVRSTDGTIVSFYLIDGCGVITYSVHSDRVSACRVVEPRGLLTASGDASRYGKGGSLYDGDLVRIRDFGFQNWSSGVSYDGREYLVRTHRGILRYRIDEDRLVERIAASTSFGAGRIFTSRSGRVLLEVTGASSNNTTRILSTGLN